MDENVHARVIARGRVQGVFYRDTMRRAAQASGVAGSAVNLADGTVECHFEGAKPIVDSMIEIAREGSSASDVDSIDVEWLEPTGVTRFWTG